MLQKPALIDIGANLTNRRFHADLDAVIAHAKEAGVEHIIVTGTSERASHDAHALTQTYPGYLSSTAGVHPHEAKQWNAKCAKAIERLAACDTVMAVGECGLDYNRMFSTETEQRACFEAQLQLAVRLQKPVFLHERDAHEDFFALLRQYRPQLKAAVVHCFTGNTEELRAYLELDCHIGITGWVCDERRGGDLRKAIKYLPKDRLMIETDAPFLLPRNLPVRPQDGRNEPKHLPVVLEAVAAILRISPLTLAQQIRKNTVQFFDLSLAGQ